ncbi:hypothetical protein ES703_110783 [subsurface metagenome]
MKIYIKHLCNVLVLIKGPFSLTYRQKNSWTAPGVCLSGYKPTGSEVDRLTEDQTALDPQTLTHIPPQDHAPVPTQKPLSG